MATKRLAAEVVLDGPLWRKIAVVLMLAPIATFYSLCNAYAAGYTASGKVERLKLIDNRNQPLVNPERRSYSFSVTCIDEKWLLRIEPYSDSPSNRTAYIEVGFDGAEIRSYLHLKERGLPKDKKPDQPVNVGIAVVHKQTVPSAEIDEVLPPLWFAYASGQYFRGKPPETGKMKPLWLNHAPSKFTEQIQFPFKAQFNPIPPYLPEHGHWDTGGKDYFWLPVQGLVQTKYEPPFDKGFTKGEYRATGSTNWEGLSIPRAFEYDQFELLRTESLKPIIQKTYVIQGVTEALSRPRTEFQFIPAISGPVLMKDARSQSSEINPSFTVTNWVSETHPASQYARRKAEQNEAYHKLAMSNNYSKRFVKSAFFGVMLLLVSAVMVAKALRNRRKLE